MSINFRDLPYRTELLKLTEAMQYAFHGEATSDYDIKNKRYWLGQVIAQSNIDVARKIKETKASHADELSSSPVLLALLDLYVAACETSDTERLKNLYLAYQNLQRDCNFENNKKAYIDAGCMLMQDFDNKNEINLSYPMHLYAAYEANGGRDDDHRGGYFFPVHKLNVNELDELYKTNPEIFKDPKINEVYQNMKANQKGSN